ncbi:MAG: hypothetical protein HC802_05295, partial [Caldilineaceae bacterium]|nr:hypothetical protein [Caldilineaceae bacterium]
MQRSSDDHPDTHPPRQWLIWALLVVIVVAAALRLWSLDNLPPGLFYDEAFNGVDARGVLSGENRPLYFTGNNGREPLYIYLQALIVALLGPNAYALRFTSALIGIVTIPLTFLAARTLFAMTPTDEPNQLGPISPEWLALFAAAGLAISYWHVNLSRLGFRAILLPLISALALLFFWKAWVGGQRRDFGWAGFWFSLAFYSYTAGRLMPFTVILFVVGEWMLSLVRRSDASASRDAWPTRWRGLVWMAVVGLICLAPLLFAIVQNPVILSSRTADVSILVKGTEGMPETPLARLGVNVVNTLRSFYDRGDLNLP